MTRFETTDLLAAVIFRLLPNGSSRLAQSSHRTARAAAVSVMDELERISRMSALPASPSVPTATDLWTCSRPDMASFDAMTGEVVTFIYPSSGERIAVTAGDCIAEQICLVTATHNQAVKDAFRMGWRAGFEASELDLDQTDLSKWEATAAASESAVGTPQGVNQNKVTP